MLESDFAFPRDYAEMVEEFDELPGTGTLKVPLIYFPPPKGRLEHNGEWLKVKAKSFLVLGGPIFHFFEEPTWKGIT